MRPLTDHALLTTGLGRNRHGRFIYSCTACAVFISRSPENSRPTILTTRRGIRENRNRRRVGLSNSSSSWSTQKWRQRRSALQWATSSPRDDVSDLRQITQIISAENGVRWFKGAIRAPAAYWHHAVANAVTTDISAEPTRSDDQHPGCSNPLSGGCRLGTPISSRSSRSPDGYIGTSKPGKLQWASHRSGSRTCRYRRRGRHRRRPQAHRGRRDARFEGVARLRIERLGEGQKPAWGFADDRSAGCSEADKTLRSIGLQYLVRQG